MITQEDYTRDAKKGLKIIGGINTVIHCHHYNARMQRTLEENDRIDGKAILKNVAAEVYSEMITNLVNEGKEKSPALIEDLFRFLGFGKLDFSNLSTGKVTCSSSHFVEGWNCGSIETTGCVCTVTEGYIKGGLEAITGTQYEVNEVSCMNEPGIDQCTFKVVATDTKADHVRAKSKRSFSMDPSKNTPETTSNIDKETIVNTVIGMPLEGNESGLIPAFNVYLAHTPQDFYNKVSIAFVEEMGKIGLEEIAKDMLTEDAENCALNTFGGILDSDEWRALVVPMIKDKRDEIFGLVAVANALGWGRINVVAHENQDGLELSSTNGYEAFGFIELKESSQCPNCFMLKGITAGLLELVYEKGDFEDRIGQFDSYEKLCMTKKDSVCHFVAER
jgi:predicted hydrocarbon binding protein